MTIDIIDYADEQFAALSEEQVMEVRSAQTKKNKLELALQNKLKKEKNRLIENGIFLSEIWAQIQQKLQTEHEAEINHLREALLFYLRFTKSNSQQAQQAPYTVDYSLSYEERYYIVRDYYEETYSDPIERVRVLREDEVAAQYLGEFYKTLYDYFLEDIPSE
ncbi:MAG: hypothetical protein IJV85_02510 [Clostridia bacterium]|nr:hypothetical protein [Clostridia bacterium]